MFSMSPKFGPVSIRACNSRSSSNRYTCGTSSLKYATTPSSAPCPSRGLRLFEGAGQHLIKGGLRDFQKSPDLDRGDFAALRSLITPAATKAELSSRFRHVVHKQLLFIIGHSTISISGVATTLICVGSWWMARNNSGHPLS